MEYSDVLSFLKAHHEGVVTTYRRSGAPQMSIVRCGPFRDTITLVARGGTAKLANLSRDPRCGVLAVRQDWRGYAVVTGTATVHDWDNTDAEELRGMLREAYTACGGGQHPDWEEYDRVMREEGRAVVMVQPEHVYGTRV